MNFISWERGQRAPFIIKVADPWPMAIIVNSPTHSYFESSTGNKAFVTFWVHKSGPVLPSTLLPHLSASSSLRFPQPTIPSAAPVCVTAMESAPASAPGVVAMEIPVRGALPVVEEDEGYSVPLPGSEELLRYRRGGGRRRRGVPFNRGGYYMLVVIGEIGTEQQLDTARAQIERGK